MMRAEDCFRIAWATSVLVLLAQTPAGAQTPAKPRDYSRPAFTTTANLDDVRPFEAWIRDTVITEGVDIEPNVRWGNNEALSALVIEALLAVWATNDFEVGGRFGFTSVDFDARGVEDASGPTDLGVYGRYRLSGGPGSEDPEFAVGALFDLPVGDEDVGASSFDFNVFGAMRTSLESGVDIFANLAIESIEVQAVDDRENGVRLGGGGIIPLTEETAFIAEGSLGTANDTFTLTAGIDYELPPGGHLRGALTVGLDDGSDDIAFTAAFSIPVY